MIAIQVRLFPEHAQPSEPVGDWAYEDELGTEISSVPNSQETELGTEIRWDPLVPNRDWKPPIGCLQEKIIKGNAYWYWRYYGQDGRKKSVYLGTNRMMSIIKARKWGIPADAKLPKQRSPAPNP
jgi:hypothetical protein